MLAPKKRNGKIDLLRFLFAVIVLIYHSRYVVGDEKSLFLGGSFAVEFFFLVSGYLMMANRLDILKGISIFNSPVILQLYNLFSKGGDIKVMLLS